MRRITTAAYFRIPRRGSVELDAASNRLDECSDPARAQAIIQRGRDAEQAGKPARRRARRPRALAAPSRRRRIEPEFRLGRAMTARPSRKSVPRPRNRSDRIAHGNRAAGKAARAARHRHGVGENYRRRSAAARATKPRSGRRSPRSGIPRSAYSTSSGPERSRTARRPSSPGGTRRSRASAGGRRERFHRPLSDHPRSRDPEQRGEQHQRLQPPVGHQPGRAHGADYGRLCDLSRGQFRMDARLASCSPFHWSSSTSSWFPRACRTSRTTSRA